MSSEPLPNNNSNATQDLQDKERPCADPDETRLLDNETGSPLGAESLPGDPTVLAIEVKYGTRRYHDRGGLGIIYHAADQILNRDVALKFIHQCYAHDEERKEYFLREAEITSRLDHPGIVPVHALGYTADGQPFYAMRFVHGETFEEAIDRHHRDEATESARQHGLGLRQLLAHFISICNTIAYAHNRGIIHRDLKPKNIMLGKFAETLVLDWGLATTVQRDHGARASGEVTLLPKSGSRTGDSSSGGIGTPAYMSPEQAEGSMELNSSTDIYSLGVILYRVLTGALPFQAENAMAVMQLVKQGKFTPPHKVKPRVPRALEAICLKAMAFRPDDRYPSPLDMIADIERWLGDEPVSAYREPVTQRVTRVMRRHRALTQLVAGLLFTVVIAVTVLVTSTWYHHEHMAQQRLQGLKDIAQLQESAILSDLEDLRRDVAFLAARPELQILAQPGDSPAQQDARTTLTGVFADFIGRAPGYMQARFIDAKGNEVLRVDRAHPGGEVTEAKVLSYKGDRPYFKEAIVTAPGRISLSKLELNVENGQKQWDFPVVRAAVPVYAPDAKQASGIVIINMHFDDLTKVIKSSHSHDSIVYLADEEGNFLLHPNQGRIGFCYERGLIFPVTVTYHELMPFLLSDAQETALERTTPRGTAWVGMKSTAAKSSKDVKRATTSIISQFPTLTPQMSDDESEALLVGVNNRQIGKIREDLAGAFGSKLVVEELLPGSQTAHTVYARRVQIDKNRFVILVVSVPVD